MGSTSEENGELHTRIRQQEVVAELGQQALETDDLDQLMRDAAVAVAETLDNEYAKVLELLPDGDEVFLRQGVGWREGLVGNATVPTDRDSQAGYTLLTEQPIIVEDLRTEERFSGPELLTSHDVVSGTSVIIGSVADPWGVLGTHTTEQREFTRDDANFVQSVANVLASAIEETTTKQELRNREAELEEVYGRVTDGFFALNEAWEFTHANDQAGEILGVDTDELLGREIWDVFPDLAGTAFETHYYAAMTTQEPVSIEEYYSPLETWFEERIFPSESGLSVYFRDVTGQKHLEQELEKTFDRITDAFIGLNRDWEITYVNERGSEILDPENEGLVGKNFWNPFEPAIGTTFETEYREAMETQEPTHFEEYYPPLKVWFEVHAYPTESGLSIYFRDATERKERERKLRESEQRYRTLAENFPNGIVTMFDDDLRYTVAAGQAFDEFPISPADAKGKSVEEVWPAHTANALEPAFRAALDGEKRVIEVEYLDREWVVHVVPIADDQGTIFGGMTIAQDITERKAYQQALEESERRYRTLVENFPNGAVGLFDEDLQYTAVGGELLNEAGVSSDERVDTTVYDIYPDAIVDEIEPYFHAALEGETNSFEVEYHDRDLFAYTLPVRNAADEIYAGMLVVQDVTKRREYQRKLEESNERLEQFAYAASHDLQEPLRMVSSYLSLVERRYGAELDDDAEEFIEYAVDGADRMREMIDGLLEYSRVDTQGDPLEPIDLERPFENALDNLQVTIEESGADIRVGSLPRVRGDAGQLHQVFQNLLSNAIEYAGDEPPEIRIDAEQRGREWVISVRDEGIGIGPDDQDRVFEVFQRLHSHEDHPGTGIGLALCQRIVERHGGEIWADSEPGEGTTFSFTLSAASE